MEKAFLNPTVKAILIFTVILLTGILLIAVGNPFKKLFAPILTPALRINAIEISADAKSILDAETKEVIFTIADTQKYLKDSGYLYNPDTFQTTNAKYAGDCFLSASLSSNKDRIVFSSGCLVGNLPQAWVGNYLINESYWKGLGRGSISDKIRLLIAGSGRNFVWSSDDKTIAYEADLGLSGLTEARTIDAATGEILDSKPKSEIDTSDWQTYRNEEYGFEVKYPKDYKIDPLSFSGSPAHPEMMIYSVDFHVDIRLGIYENVAELPGGNKKNLSLEDWLSEISKEEYVMAEYNIEYFNGLKAFRVRWQGITVSEDVMIEHSGRIYYLSIGDNSDQNIMKIFDQILSTFKFIK